MSGNCFDLNFLDFCGIRDPFVVFAAGEDVFRRIVREGIPTSVVQASVGDTRKQLMKITSAKVYSPYNTAPDLI